MCVYVCCCIQVYVRVCCCGRVYRVMTVAWGDRFMTVINTSSPLFPLSNLLRLHLQTPLVNIEILGTSVGGGKLTIFW